MLLDEVGAHSTSLRALWVCLHQLLIHGRALRFALSDRPRACLLAEFIVERIVGGHYSIMESLARNGF